MRALGVVALAAGALVGVYATLVRTSAGQRLDQATLDQLGTSGPTRDTVAGLLQTITVTALTVVLLGCVATALVRRSWTLAVGAPVLVGGALLVTELLKREVLSRPDLGYGVHNTLPSGHTTVVASLVLAGLLVVPRRGRWAVQLVGSLGVAVTGVGTVVAGWHRPSDVFAGLAVTLGWGALVLAVVALRVRRPADRAATARPFALVAGLAVAAAVFVALGVRPNGSARDLLVHLLAMGGLALAGAAVVGLFGWMVDRRLP